MEQLHSRRNRAQASLEFIIVLTMVLLLATAFLLSITDEYSRTFVLSSVKSAAEHEISLVSLSQPGCSNTSLVSMGYSAGNNVIILNISGCAVNMTSVAQRVETEMCGAKTPSGGTVMLCSGVYYTIVGI